MTLKCKRCGLILSWVKSYFPLFIMGMVIYDNEFETQANKI